MLWISYGNRRQMCFLEDRFLSLGVTLEKVVGMQQPNIYYIIYIYNVF